MNKRGMEEPQPTDEFLEQMKRARNRPAVLKIRLVTLRGFLPRTLIFAFEGDDDKIVYFQWINRIRSDLNYEPFPCGGKEDVLQLREIVKRDRGNIGDGIYYFIDRDFDDFAGYEPDSTIYMTDSYSLENYLVSATTLTELLKNEFHCHAHPHIRIPIIEQFKKVYHEFLLVTRAINFKIFIARRLHIKIQDMPKKINDVAIVGLEKVGPPSASADEKIILEITPNSEEIDSLFEEFDILDPQLRYRGKFAYLFFRRWLDLLADDYVKITSALFGNLTRSSNVRRSELVLGNIASKSELPKGLREFILAIQPPH